MFGTSSTTGSSVTRSHPPMPGLIPVLSRPLASSQVPTADKDTPADDVSAPARSLSGGCYLVRFTPENTSGNHGHFDGTLRLERTGVNAMASGDLYFHPFPGPQSPEPSPARGIPIFRRDRYAAYFRAVEVQEVGERVVLSLEIFFYDSATNQWNNDMNELFTADLAWTPGPPDHPNPSEFLRGELKNSSGTSAGTFSMGLVSKRLRRAVIRMDKVAGEVYPEHNGRNPRLEWVEVYEQVGWDVTLDLGTEDAPAKPEGQAWTLGEIHQTMLERRGETDLDTEWRYHILVVPTIQAPPGRIRLGYMYDHRGGQDANNVPREGAVVASRAKFPDVEDTFGRAKNKQMIDVKDVFFRTAVHEIGHAHGLDHLENDSGLNAYMKATGDILPSRTFPDDIDWTFREDTAKRLRHLPDPWVRPGGIEYDLLSGSAANRLVPGDFIDNPEGHELEVRPLDDLSFPLGAPVRVDLSLVNRSDRDLVVHPGCLSFKSGQIRGYVVGPAGTAREFLPLLRCCDVYHEPERVPPNGKKRHSLTLFGGPQGILFGAPGLYRILIQTLWTDENGIRRGAKGETSVMVLPPSADQEHARTVRNVLASRQVLTAVVFGGSEDQLKDGVPCIQKCLRDQVLGPHYTAIEARRLAREALTGRTTGRTRDQTDDINHRLRSGTTVATSAEVSRIIESDVIQSDAKKVLVKSVQDEFRRKYVTDKLLAFLRSKK